jgi:hypothetical protein
VSSGDDGGSNTPACIDHDGDGYGQYCALGPDCDDNDPTITDQCRRCAATGQDCPCKAGTMPVTCKPPTIIGDGGTFVCSEGTRYCRDGYWSACEILGQYVFVKSQ